MKEIIENSTMVLNDGNILSLAQFQNLQHLWMNFFHTQDRSFYHDFHQEIEKLGLNSEIVISQLHQEHNGKRSAVQSVQSTYPVLTEDKSLPATLIPRTGKIFHKRAERESNTEAITTKLITESMFNPFNLNPIFLENDLTIFPLLVASSHTTEMIPVELDGYKSKIPAHLNSWVVKGLTKEVWQQIKARYAKKSEEFKESHNFSFEEIFAQTSDGDNENLEEEFHKSQKKFADWISGQFSDVSLIKYQDVEGNQVDEIESGLKQMNEQIEKRLFAMHPQASVNPEHYKVQFGASIGYADPENRKLGFGSTSQSNVAVHTHHVLNHRYAHEFKADSNLSPIAENKLNPDYFDMFVKRMDHFGGIAETIFISLAKKIAYKHNLDIERLISHGFKHNEQGDITRRIISQTYTIDRENFPDADILLFVTEIQKETSKIFESLKLMYAFSNIAKYLLTRNGSEIKWSEEKDTVFDAMKTLATETNIWELLVNKILGPEKLKILFSEGQEGELQSLTFDQVMQSLNNKVNKANGLDFYTPEQLVRITSQMRMPEQFSDEILEILKDTKITQTPSDKSGEDFLKGYLSESELINMQMDKLDYHRDDWQNFIRKRLISLSNKQNWLNQKFAKFDKNIENVSDQDLQKIIHQYFQEFFVFPGNVSIVTMWDKKQVRINIMFTSNGQVEVRGTTIIRTQAAGHSI